MPRKIYTKPNLLKKTYQQCIGTSNRFGNINPQLRMTEAILRSISHTPFQKAEDSWEKASEIPELIIPERGRIEVSSSHLDTYHRIAAAEAHSANQQPLLVIFDAHFDIYMTKANPVVKSDRDIAEYILTGGDTQEIGTFINAYYESKEQYRTTKANFLAELLESGAIPGVVCVGAGDEDSLFREQNLLLELTSTTDIETKFCWWIRS